MVTRLNWGKDIGRTIHYNERKVQLGEACCILAHGFHRDAPELTLKDKLRRWDGLRLANPRVLHWSIHLSLNFHPSEDLPIAVLQKISRFFMESAGLGGQPFLAYRHTDAGHPHIHLVSCLLRPDGSRIDPGPAILFRLRELNALTEQKFSLRRVHADANNQISGKEPLQRALYGRRPTVETLRTTLEKVLGRYQFSSRDAMRVLLQSYGIHLIQHRKGADDPASGGPWFQLMNNSGIPRGVPLPAATLGKDWQWTSLNQRMESNAQTQAFAAARVLVKLNWILLQDGPYWEPGQAEALRQAGLQWVLGSRARDRYLLDHSAGSVLPLDALTLDPRLDEYLNDSRLKPSRKLGEGEPLPGDEGWQSRFGQRVFPALGTRVSRSAGAPFRELMDSELQSLFIPSGFPALHPGIQGHFPGKMIGS